MSGATILHGILQKRAAFGYSPRPGQDPDAQRFKREYQQQQTVPARPSLTPERASRLSTMATYIGPGFGVKPIFNRALGYGGGRGGIPYQGQGQQRFSPMVRTSTDDIFAHVTGGRSAAHVPLSGGTFAMPPVGNDPSFIAMTDEELHQPRAYAHELAHYYDPHFRRQGVAGGEEAKLLRDGAFSAATRLREIRTGYPSNRYEEELPAIVAENVAALRKEPVAARDLEELGETQAGPWIYNHMLRYGPQFSEDPEITKADEAELQRWMQDLRSKDSRLGSIYRTWREQQGHGIDPDKLPDYVLEAPYGRLR